MPLDRKHMRIVHSQFAQRVREIGQEGNIAIAASVISTPMTAVKTFTTLSQSQVDVQAIER